jgi:hypothetical protein
MFHPFHLQPPPPPPLTPPKHRPWRHTPRPQQRQQQEQQQYALEDTSGDDHVDQQQQLPQHADVLPKAVSSSSSSIPVSSSLEVEGSSSGSWRGRIPWLHRKQKNRKPRSDAYANYVGGPMGPDGLMRMDGAAHAHSLPLTPPPPQLSPAIIPLPSRKHTTSFQRVASWLTGRGVGRSRSSDHDEDSIRDFDASEWTPQDSSYGAAIPVAGWIPKGIRRSIEWTLIGGVAAVIVFLIVRTSLRAEASNNSHRKSVNETTVDNYYSVDNLDLDDDRYISYATYSSNAAGDDDLVQQADDAYVAGESNDGNGQEVVDTDDYF